MSSQTWQCLPERLLEPVMDGVILLHEASELWDLFLLNPGEWFCPPQHLLPMLDRLRLWEMDARPTRH